MEATTPAAAGGRRRQARGERRTAQLLDAAAVVFCRSGYAAAGMNAIAREAGVSPGTLYQFFPDKATLAARLGERLLRQLAEVRGRPVADASLPLEAMLDALLDPIVEFSLRNPVFTVLVHGPDGPGGIPMALRGQLEEMIALWAPALPGAQRVRVATTAFAVLSAGLSLVAHHEGAERTAYTAELKAALTRYLAPVTDTSPRPKHR
ncbi:TetR/AcrR family transcriptional regulator [Streptomyces sp. TRM S81-3]|uniref:TetR/AcrR family transcriptional regulator n=1 Tax=Streptomyces griseicoloratus TaxID=2752516 RepID=A0A926L672_9ACTN|nr:TetR/AcrR family transcriptional regulator [Streptomyces griseicoloratus]MBD0423375.1 TetR/AcrR family transcriptional regulator [Streptomyces griseicoloratus]